jgi:hypothetical protein
VTKPVKNARPAVALAPGEAEYAVTSVVDLDAGPDRMTGCPLKGD